MGSEGVLDRDMSLGEYLKMGLKTRMSRCGTAVEPGTLAERAVTMSRIRRESRHSLLFRNRNLTTITLSPIISPIKVTKPPTPVPKVDARLDMLRKWQADKKKKLELTKLKKKPIFKVYHVKETNANRNLETALTEIKGVPFKNTVEKAFTKVAPSSTYKFKPPVNIKPVVLNSAARTGNQRNLRSVKQKLKYDSEIKVNRDVGKKLNMAVNSKVAGHTKRSNRVVKPSTAQVKSNNSDKENDLIQNSVISSSTTEALDDLSAPLTPKNSKQTKTSPSASSAPDNGINETSVVSIIHSTYTSPYVTVSRGKFSARKEFEKKFNGELCDNGSSPMFAATHFRKVVNAETERLQKLCEKWTNYKETENPAEEACDMINVAIGQTELLLAKKFKQFHNLIDNCLSGNSEKPITEFDLQGFWDISMLQVNNLDKRFQNLDTLKMNNWEEILPEVTTKVKPKRQLKKTTSKASSVILAAIKEARKRKAKVQEHDEDVVLTPNQCERRRSIRLSIKDVRSMCKTCSPTRSTSSVTSITISSFMKRTPAYGTAKSAKSSKSSKSMPKSILKSARKSYSKSDLRKSKSVLFSDLDTDDLNENNQATKVVSDTKENDQAIINSLSKNPTATGFFTPRRSARLNQKIMDQ